MARLKSQLWMAPLGEDVTSDPLHLPESRWPRVVNFMLDRPGNLRGVGGMTSMGIAAGNVKIDGIGYFDTSSVFYQYNPSVISGYLCISINGQVQLSPYVSPGLPPLFSNAVSSAGLTGMTAGQRTRFVPFGSEMIVAQDGAVNNWYIRASTGQGGTLGTPDPTVAPTVTTGTGSLPAGTYNYAYTYVNYLNQESDYSPETAYSSSGTGASVTIPGMSNSDKYAVANVYRTKVNGVLLYFLKQVTYVTNSFIDTTPDADLGVQAPNPGENGPPLAGNVMASHKSRMWMNVSSQPQVLQVSNFGSASQWSSLPIPATDGEKLLAQSDNSDFIVAMTSFKSILIVFRRKSILGVFGDDITNFQVLPLQLKGLYAPDSMTRCEDYLAFLAVDGVYLMDAGYSLHKISKSGQDGGIESLLQSLYLTTAGRQALQNAVGWYVDRHYYLSISTYTFIYDIDHGSWHEASYAAFGSSTINAATVAYINQEPAIAFVGMSGAPYGTWFLDNYNQGQTIANFTATSPPLPDRGSLKTAVSLRVFGTGTVNSATVMVNYDTKSYSYPVNATYPGNPESVVQGILIYQEFNPDVWGRNISFTLAMNGTNINLTDWFVEYYVEN